MHSSNSSSHPIILCTDFGSSGPYVGQMKLVIAKIAPDSQVIDLVHDLPPQNLMAAHLIIKQSVSLLPHPCIVCAVIDPGVGSERKILAASFESGTQIIIPDNGMFSAFQELGPATTIVEVTNPEFQNRTVSPVFHGRDIFAPAAAHLSNGVPIEKLGAPFHNKPCELSWPQPIHHEDHISGNFLFADHFGNVITNIPSESATNKANAAIHAKGQKIPLLSHYAQANPGDLIAVGGSFGYIEVAIRNGSARKQLKFEDGESVKLCFDS